MVESRQAIVSAYQRGLTAFADGARAACDDPLLGSALRLEVQFESLRDWSLVGTVDDARAWFLARRAECPMVIVTWPMNELRQWIVDPLTGDVSHESGEFFRVHGIRVHSAGSREVGAAGWDQPILTQVGYDGGLLGLLRQRFDGIPHYLLEAKAEPGNYQKLQLSPTLQATFSNLRRAHAGRRPHFAEYFETPDSVDARVLYDAWLSEDGGRLYLKRNRGMLVEVDASAKIPLLPGFRWFSMHQIKTLLHEDAWVNPHVRGIIAHL